MNEKKLMNMKMDSSWNASGNNNITDRVMAMCKGGTIPKIPSRQIPGQTSV
jgi:hypothetical protein